MDNIRCGGQELEISECRFDSWGENDCDPSEAAGVVCDSQEVQKPKSSLASDRPDAAKAKKIQKHKIKVMVTARATIRLPRVHARAQRYSVPCDLLLDLYTK